MMGGLWQVAAESARDGTAGLHASHCTAGDLRTLERYLLDPVLLVLALVSIAALTAVMIVAIVGAVADMGQMLHNPADEVLQPGWCLTQAVWHEEDAYNDYMASVNGPEGTPYPQGYDWPPTGSMPQ